jgi:hypothetical protein
MTVTTITYYDFCNLQYAGFYLKGFQQNADERGYRLAISHHEPPELEELGLTKNWLPKTQAAFLICRYEGDDSFLFIIDTSDQNGDVATGEGYQYPLLEASRYYFKVNYNAQAIAGNPKLAPYATKIFPAPIVFPVAVSQPWRFLPKLTPLGGPAWPRHAVQRRFKNLNEIPSLEDYQRMRATPKDIDAFFIVPLRKVVDHDYNVNPNERRMLIVEGLNKYKRYNMVARYVTSNASDEVTGPYVIPRLRLGEYLDLMARSRIGIYVRGYHGCLSFKFGELMALGSPVVGETILNNTDFLYSFDHFDEQFAYDEPEQIVERVIYLLENPAKAEELRQANIETFINHLSPRPAVATILDRLEGKSPAIETQPRLSHRSTIVKD